MMSQIPEPTAPLPAAPAPLLPAGRNGSVYATGSRIELGVPSIARVVSGNPREGIVPLGTLGDTEIGIWELRTGTVTDVELDEVFVVLSGNATIEFLEEDRSLVVGAGDVVRLVAGSRTRWTVQDHIRKVSIARPAP